MISEDSLHAARLFLTLALQLQLTLVKWWLGQLLTLFSGLILLHPCGWISLWISFPWLYKVSLDQQGGKSLRMGFRARIVHSLSGDAWP